MVLPSGLASASLSFHSFMFILRYNWKILPNVNELLEKLSKRKDVTIGLLTGVL